MGAACQLLEVRDGNFGADHWAVFTLNHCAPGCAEHNGVHNPHPRPQPYCNPRTGVWITPPIPSLDLSLQCRSGSTVVLVMCENVKPSRFFLEMFDAESGRPVGECSGVTLDDP